MTGLLIWEALGIPRERARELTVISHQLIFDSDFEVTSFSDAIERLIRVSQTKEELAYVCFHHGTVWEAFRILDRGGPS